jgi:hypothetical protein
MGRRDRGDGHFEIWVYRRKTAFEDEKTFHYIEGTIHLAARVNTVEAELFVSELEWFPF